MSLFGGRRREQSDAERDPTSDTPGAAAATPPGSDTTSNPPALAGAAGARERAREMAPRGQGDSSVANIGKSIVFKGDLTGDEDIEIEGSIDGRIDLPKNQLTIGANGRVKAEVNAKDVVVIGRVTGNVSATERLEIQSSGIVEGDIRAPRLLIQEGAVVNGAIEMSSKAGAAGAAAPKAPSAPSAPGQTAQTSPAAKTA